MLDTVLTLVFSIVMLVFMAFPAIKTTQWLQETYDMPEKWHTPLVIVITISLSLLVGLFLRFY